METCQITTITAVIVFRSAASQLPIKNGSIFDHPDASGNNGSVSVAQVGVKCDTKGSKQRPVYGLTKGRDTFHSPLKEMRKFDLS